MLTGASVGHIAGKSGKAAPQCGMGGSTAVRMAVDFGDFGDFGDVGAAPAL